MFEEILKLDSKLFLFLNNLGTTKFDAFWLSLSKIEANIFKDSFQRLRPCYNESISDSLRLVKENCGGKYGFFSAHASNSFSLAIFFGLLFKNRIRYMIIITIVYASLISYSRIYLGVHFPIDIIVGSSFGIFVGFIIYSFVYLKFLKFFDKA